MMNKRFQWIILAGIIIFLILYPLIFGEYTVNLFVSFAIFALFSVSFNILLGFTGLLSFGHAMFFGIGGYGTALALTHIPGLSLFPALFIGIFSAIILALIVCPVVVRVSGTAFCMIHLAFGELMYVISLKLRGLTGGEDGIGGFPIPHFSIPGLVSINLKTSINFYYFAIIIVGVSLLIIWFLTKTPFGQIQVGIRDNANRIDYLGFRVPHTKAVIYVISGAFAGVAGSLYALFQNLISADALFVGVSFAAVANTLVGGVGSFFGPIIGTAIFQLLQEVTTRFTERVEIVMGVIIVLIIMFAPMGMHGLFYILKQKWLSFYSSKFKKVNVEKIS